MNGKLHVISTTNLENTKDEVGDLKKELVSPQKELAEAKKSGSLSIY